MARKYYVVPVASLKLEHLAASILTSLETLRMPPDRTQCVVKLDEKSPQCAELEKAGVVAMTAKEARAVADTWDTDEPVKPLDATEIAAIEKRSDATLDAVCLARPRLADQKMRLDVAVELAKLEAVEEPLETVEETLEARKR